MIPENITRIAFALILLSVVAVGLPYRLKAHRGADRFDRVAQEGKATFFILRLSGFSLWVICLTYPIFPGVFEAVSFPKTGFVQLVGLVMALTAIPMAHQVFTTIGKNITDTVETRAQHELVTSGVYRYIRHPLYTTAFLLFNGLGLLASNWLILLMSLVAMLAIGIRTKTEEQKLTERFGEKYTDYMKRTGRFFPKIG